MTDNSSLRKEYVARINNVLNFIGDNIDSEFTLEQLASEANFSPYHFHRIFGAIMNEPLFQYIKRIRIEKAADFLVLNKERPVTEIAYDCGFSGSATFARAFKEYFNMSASEWRNGGYIAYSKERKTNSKDGKQAGNECKENILRAFYIRNVYDTNYNINKWRIEMKENDEFTAEVEVKDLPDTTVAYIRHIGKYQGNPELFASLFGKLFSWAGPRGLLANPDQKCMSVYYDNPKITEDDKLRLDVCLPVPPETEVTGDVGKMLLKGGKYAVARFELTDQEYPKAWAAVYAGWLPESGYQPDDKPCFEIYHNNPEEHPEHKHIVDICIPVKPM